MIDSWVPIEKHNGSHMTPDDEVDFNLFPDGCKFKIEKGLWWVSVPGTELPATKDWDSLPGDKDNPLFLDRDGGVWNEKLFYQVGVIMGQEFIKEPNPLWSTQGGIHRGAIMNVKQGLYSLVIQKFAAVGMYSVLIEGFEDYVNANQKEVKIK